MMKMPGTPESYAHELCSRETPKREANEGLAPWLLPALKKVRRPPRVAKEVVGLG